MNTLFICLDHGLLLRSVIFLHIPLHGQMSQNQSCTVFCAKCSGPPYVDFGVNYDNPLTRRITRLGRLARPGDLHFFCGEDVVMLVDSEAPRFTRMISRRGVGPEKRGVVLTSPVVC
uniref:Uncharacterized protein n=1 Tax=Esox lucius TaxID=8010 RepID=A0A3P8ZDK5_ESOLU